MGEPSENPTQYHELVDALVYLTMTWPDISHAKHVVRKFVQLPLQFTMLLYLKFSLFFMALYLIVFSFPSLRHWRFILSVMLIGLDILQMVAPSHDFVCFLVILLFHGTLRSKMWYADIVLSRILSYSWHYCWDYLAAKTLTRYGC